MDKQAKRIIAFGTICLILISASIISISYYLFLPVEHEYDIELKAGYYDNEPKVFEDEDGNPKGIFPELLDSIAKEKKWKINWIKGTWTECLERLENGEIDIMVDVAYSDNRSETYDFNSVEVLNNWGIIYSKEDQNIESIQNLDGKKIAVMNGSIHTIGEDGILNLTKKWNVDCEFIMVDNYEEVFEKIDKGTADAGVVNRIFGLYNEQDYNIKRTSIIFNPNRLLFAFPKNVDRNQQIIPQIDEQLLALKEDTDSIYYQLIDTYIYRHNYVQLPVWVFPTLIFAFAMVIIFVSSSYILKRRVDSKTTEIKKAHRELERKVEERTRDLSKANERLKSLDQLKSMFIASMSHELRTPLTSIIGFSKILLKGWAGKFNEEQKKQLRIIRRSADHLLGLINEIIDISKIEAGKLDLKIEKFDLVEMVNHLEESFKVKLQEKDINLHLSAPDTLMVQSDKKRIKEILFNLVGNAVKYTDFGSVSVCISQEQEKIKISVTDTGIGIKDEDFDKLFKPFSRISSSEGKEGTGLGLHLSQKLANLLNGEIIMESEYGKGSSFTLILKS